MDLTVSVPEFTYRREHLFVILCNNGFHGKFMIIQENKLVLTQELSCQKLSPSYRTVTE